MHDTKTFCKFNESNKMKLPDPRRVVASLFPILRWCRSYDLNNAVGDLIAGVTVALTLIPQSIAYASLAGFEPQYGLYASFVGGFIYAVMGTCPQINIGPTALLSLLTFTYTNGTNPDFAVLLCFVAGIVQLIAGCLQLGFLVEFVSLPVVSGFTSAAAITIASSQIKGLLGLKFSAESFVGTWKGVFHHIAETRLEDTLLSLVCCIVLLGMKALKDIRVKSPEDEKGRKTAQIVERTLWFVGVARNAVVVVIAAVAAFFLYADKEDPLILTGDITPGLPPLSLPPFATTVGNTTYTAGDMFSHLGSGLLVVPLVGIISNVAIAKAFARGRTLDATQEIVALGACNLAGAFFRSFPVNGSFTRSAVSDASGVRTPAAGFYTGIIVILTLLLLTPYFFFIPRAALAAVIICAVLHMVDIDIVKKLWATSRLDLIPLFGTVLCCLLLGIEVGLICGVGIDVVLLLYYHSRPPLDVQYVNDGISPPHYAIHPVGGLHFAGAERVRSKLIALRNPNKASPQAHSPHVTALETLRVIPDEVRSAENGTNGLRSDTQNDTSYTENATNGLRSGTNALQHDASNTENSINGLRNGTNALQNDASNIENGTNELENGANTLRNETSNATDSNPDYTANAVNNNVLSNGTVTTRSSERRKLDILVVHCDRWYKMDYTFLQSLKMLVSEWSRYGVIVWCDAKPTIRGQLDTILHDPVYCSSDELRMILTSLSVIEEPSGQLTSDTQL